MKTYLPILMLYAAIHFGFAQSKPIEFLNSSFEDFSNKSKPPFNWYDCGFPGESPPDIQPNSAFEVTKEAWHGKSYLSLVVRDNNTRGMAKQVCLSFTICRYGKRS